MSYENAQDETFTAPEPRLPSKDPFVALLGKGRGLDDPHALAARLAATERQLVSAEAVSADLRIANQQLVENCRELSMEADALDDALAIAKAAGAWSRRERDIARYDAMRGGRPDPLPDIDDEVHHGLWTPGRPYLTHQHVYEPRTSACYRAREGGAPVGARPARSTRWRRCRGSGCPSLPAMNWPRHPSEGFALRQSSHWWDRDQALWLLAEMPMDYLEAAIAWLRGAAVGLYIGELHRSNPCLPCPAWAYPSPRSWISDTPLMRALLAERRTRRRLAAARDAAAHDSDEH